MPPAGVPRCGGRHPDERRADRGDRLRPALDHARAPGDGDSPARLDGRARAADPAERLRHVRDRRDRLRRSRSTSPARASARAIVQRRSVEREHLQGGLAHEPAHRARRSPAVTLVLAAVVVRPVFGDETAQLVALTTPWFLIGAIVALPLAVLRRRLDFRRLSLLGLVQSAVRARDLGRVRRRVRARRRRARARRASPAMVAMLVAGARLRARAAAPLARGRRARPAALRRAGRAGRRSRGSASATATTRSSARGSARPRPASTGAASSWPSSTRPRSAR